MNELRVAVAGAGGAAKARSRLSSTCITRSTGQNPDPTWSSAYLVMLWQYYIHYGDRTFLAEHFDSMKRYVDYLGTQATNHILPQYWIGDWGTIVEGWKEGEPVSVVTACYYYDTIIFATLSDTWA